MSRLLGTVLFVVLCATHFQAGLAQSPTAADTIADLKTFRQLKEKVVDRQVDLEATVTFVEPVWNLLFVQDGDFATFVGNANTKGLASGDRVRIVGIGQPGDVNSIIHSKRIERVGTGQLPTPIPIDFSKLEIGDHDALYVTAQGTVVRAVSGMGHTLYTCEQGGAEFHVSVIESQPRSKMWSKIGAKIEFVGVLGISLQIGTEDHGTLQRPRPIASLRVVCMQEPRTIVDGQYGELPLDFDIEDQAQTFFLDGQVTLDLRDSFVMQSSQESLKLEFPKLHGFSIQNVVRVGGIRRRDLKGNLKLEALVVEALFSTRLPSPTLFQEIEPDQRNFTYVKVSGRPKNIRKDGDRVCFEITQDGQTANVELLKEAYTSVELLQKTKLLEVNGVVTRNDLDGSCDVVVQNSKYVSLIEPLTPYWKYATWILLPISGLFLLGFVRTKIQRTREAATAAAIKSMHTRLVSTYQAINDGLLAVDMDDRVLSVNAAFCKLADVKLNPGETFKLAKCFVDRINDPSPVKEFLRSGLQHERRIEFEIVKPEPASFDLSVSPIAAEEGEQIGRLIVLRDRTSEKQIQAELIHANKIEAVGQLVGGIAHNINNIMTTIMANLSLLSGNSALNAEVKGQIADAELATVRGTDLVKRLLTYSGKSELKPKACSINDLVRELHKFAGATFDNRYKFNFDLDASEPNALIDPRSVEQIILNLFLNARDAMPNGGSINTITRLETEFDEPVVRIWVADNGPGVPDDISSQIFEPFFTTKAGQAGTGLGLSTSKRMAAEQNGRLDYLKTSESGYSFQLTLPTTKQPVIDKAQQPGEPHFVATTKAKTVLVVDDEDSILKVCTMILSKHGFEVLTAEHGEAALEILTEKHQQIGLMVTDITMPGISGLELRQISIEKYPRIPVVLCSGYLAGISAELGQDCIKLSKPFSAKQLVAVVNQGLQQKSVSSR